MKDLTVYILTHNRLEFLCEAIESVLNQDCADFRIVVSDNSTDDRTENYFLQHTFKREVEYIRRKPSLSSFDHFNAVLEEVKTQYFMLFHDDDLMLPEMISTAYGTIIAEQNIVAVGYNAYYLLDKTKTTKTPYRSKPKQTFLHAKNMAESYLNKWSVVPFPFHMYNHHLIKKIRFTQDAGKYSDVLFLLTLVNTGLVYWLAKPLGYYRIHGGQDSGSFDYVNQLKLLKVYKSYGCDHRKIQNYRVFLLYERLIGKLKTNSLLSPYLKKQLGVLLFYSPFNFFPKIIIRKIIHKY